MSSDSGLSVVHHAALAELSSEPTERQSWDDGSPKSNPRLSQYSWRNEQSLSTASEGKKPNDSNSSEENTRDDSHAENPNASPDPNTHSSIQSSATSTCSNDQKTSEPPYHVFTQEKKKQLVYIVSLAGLFSPLSSNIYFPALGQISRSLGVSMSVVSLTITVYMVVQGIAPSFWGPLSDTKGRRITFIGTFIVYLLANIGLAFTNNFTVLMIFRGIQAAGSAATISVGAGVIGDITTPKERGGLVGIFGGIRMVGQSIGPVFGGVIAQYLGFHAIFWVLFGLGSMTLLLILLLLPETLRSIAGNGTIRLTGIHRPIIYNSSQPPDSQQDEEPQVKTKLTVASLFGPLRFLFEKDVFITLFFGSIVYSVWSMVTSSTTALFQAQFSLNDLQTGLIFLPNGAGCILGSYLTGYLMDNDYRAIERRYRSSKGIDPNIPLNKNELHDFPIEKARLRNIWWIIALFILATSLYGFSLRLNHLAPPLILQFVIAYTATAVFSLNSTLVIDLYPGASASATAVNNLMRCSVGAAGVAVVQIIIDGIGTGFAFLVLAGITAVASPLVVVEWLVGERWREERRERLRIKEEERVKGDLERN